MVSTVKWQVATYSGEEKVYGVDPNDDPETVTARARGQVMRRSGGSFPLGYESWREASREPDGDGK